MSLFNGEVEPVGLAVVCNFQRSLFVFPRTGPEGFEDELTYYEPAKLWMYANVRLLFRPLATVGITCGESYASPRGT